MKKHIVLDCDDTFYSPRERRPFDDAIEIIPRLARIATMEVVTRGERELQMQKLSQCPFVHCFTGEPHIVAEDIDKFTVLKKIKKRIEKQYGDSSRLWIAGNRRDCEMEYALELGLNCAWFRRGKYAHPKPRRLKDPTITVCDFYEFWDYWKFLGFRSGK